jgi:purine catabolism regulator
MTVASAQHEDVSRVYQSQQALIRAALRGDRALVARLAHELGGWAVLLDATGAVRHACPRSAAAHATDLAPDLSRLHGTTASAAITRDGDHVVLHAFGIPRRRLAVGVPAHQPALIHKVVGTAVSLLTLQLQARRPHREPRAALAALLLGVPRPDDLPEPPVRVLACAGGDAVLDALENAPVGETCHGLPRPGACAVIVPDRHAEEAAALAVAFGPVGVGAPAPLEDAAVSLRQADRALVTARRTGGVVRHGELTGQGLLGLLDQVSAQEFAAAQLAPVLAHDPDLARSLRAYLAANGEGEAAARAMGVHRHTMRLRMRKVADLLGRDLGDPGVRADLWIALTVHADHLGKIDGS